MCFSFAGLLSRLVTVPFCFLVYVPTLQSLNIQPSGTFGLAAVGLLAEAV